MVSILNKFVKGCSTFQQADKKCPAVFHKDQKKTTLSAQRWKSVPLLTHNIKERSLWLRDHKMFHNSAHGSQDVPLSGTPVRSQHLVGTPPDIRVGVTVELLQSLGHLELQVCRSPVTHGVQHLLPHIHRLVINHLKDSVPEICQVSLDTAWAHLFQRTLTHLWRRGFGMKSNVCSLINSTVEIKRNLRTKCDLSLIGGLKWFLSFAFWYAALTTSLNH